MYLFVFLAAASWARNNNNNNNKCARVSVGDRARSDDYKPSSVIKFIGRAYLARHM